MTGETGDGPVASLVDPIPGSEHEKAEHHQRTGASPLQASSSETSGSGTSGDETTGDETIGDETAGDAEEQVRQRLRRTRALFPFFPARPEHVLATLPAVDPSALLWRLASAPARARDDLRGSRNLEGGSGGQLGHFVEVGPFFVKTGESRRYSTLEQALGSERPAELRRRSLGLYPSHRWLFFTLGGDEGVWCCSVARRLETLRERFNSTGADEACWQIFLQSLRTTFDLLERRSLLLDCNPNNFGIDGQDLLYLDDDVLPVSGPVALGTQALLRLREYPRAQLGSRRRFLLGFEALLREHGRERVRSWGLVGDLETRVLWPAEPELRSILERVHRWLLSTRSEG